MFQDDSKKNVFRPATLRKNLTPSTADDNMLSPGSFGAALLSSGSSSDASFSAASSALMNITGGSPSGLQFTLTVNGLPPQQFAVVDFTLTEALSVPWTLEVSMASPDPAVDFSAVLDNNATLCVWRDGVAQREVRGIVVFFEQGDTGFHQTRYRMTLRPELWRTSLRSNSRIFQQQTPEEIITTLLRERGVVSVAFSLRYSHPAREFCVQYQEDDLSFINRLSAEEGMYYYFEAGENGDTLVFADDTGPLPKGPTLQWNPNVQAQEDELCVNAFSRCVQVRPAKVELRDYTFKNPRWQGKFSEHAQELHNQRQDYEYYAFPGRFKDDQHGQDFTRYHLDGLRNDADTGNGKSNASELSPGLLFTLTSHPRADLNTRWQVVSIIHEGRQPQALENEAGEQGTTFSNRFSFIPAHQTWRPAPLPKPKMDGSQVALVVGPPDEEIYCDNYGRVRVQFPWDREAKGDDTSSCWIRVSQPWAGQGWGVIATPRVGQEVVVDFLHGDPDQPIIIGRTYHANNLPSIGLPAAKTQMAFRSKTHKGEGYNELKFEDAGGKEELSMHAQKDMNTKVLNDRSTDVVNNHSESVGNNQSVDITNDQTVTVGNNQTVTVTGNQQETVSKDQTVMVNQNQNITVTGNRSLTVTKGQYSTEIVAGNQFVTVSAGSRTLEVAKGHSVMVHAEGQQTIIEAGGQLNNITGGQENTITGSRKLTVTGDQETSVNGKLLLVAGESIVLQCGAVSLEIKNDGSVLLNGQTFTFAATGDVGIDGSHIKLNG